MKHVNHRFNWVEERMCGLCFWGRLFGYLERGSRKILIPQCNLVKI